MKQIVPSDQRDFIQSEFLRLVAPERTKRSPLDLSSLERSDRQRDVRFMDRLLYRH